ncbi:MAG: trypsin-like peptidase domain-containing protein [Aureibaculum sp.]
MKKIASLVLASVLGGMLALGGYIFMIGDQQTVENNNQSMQPKVVQTNYIPTSTYAAEVTDFTKAAEETVNAVVHVKNVSVSSSNPLLEWFYGEGAGGGKTTVGTGSGVIISPDGYIISNNHVIKGAKELEITLNNKKTYKAEVVGAHESSDIALLKISANDLPYVSFANSDNIKVGEWVLAVGNPFNLTSTVTAGIVSAKARDIHISRTSRMIESFIQTDAVVNPGNSGGALVNVRGELVGINTAITSQTGSYIGYSFAVPSNIAKKVVEDIMEFGDVQTAYLGINYQELNNDTAKELELNTTEGVLITAVTDNGAAKISGLKPNDIITKIDEVEISKFSDLQGFLSSKRPGDIVSVNVLRNGVNKEFNVRLTNQFGKENIGKLDFSKYHIGELKKISSKDATKYRINYGVEIINLRSNYLQGVKNGNIILKIDDVKVYEVEEIEQILRKNKGKQVILQILNEEGAVEYLRMFIQN